MSHPSYVPEMSTILGGNNFNLDDMLLMQESALSDNNRSYEQENVLSSSMIFDSIINSSNADTTGATTSSKKDMSQATQKPKRPLSAYNFFFAQERKLILNEMPIRAEGKLRRSHGKIGFADLARNIAAKWKTINDEERKQFSDKAAVDKDRYIREMNEWKKTQLIEVAEAAASIGPNFHQLNGLVRSSAMNGGFSGMSSSSFSMYALGHPDKSSMMGMNRNNTFSVEPDKYSNYSTQPHLTRASTEPAFSVAEAFALNRSKLLQSRISAALNTINLPIGEDENALSNCILQGVRMGNNSILSMNRMSTSASFSMPQHTRAESMFEQQQPGPISPLQISELATQLDDESTQLLLNIFR